MKSKIKKLWGIGLIVTVLASLLVVAVPVQAANPLTWNAEAVPTVGGNVLGPAGVDILDMAVSADGNTIWAAPGATNAGNVYKSTNGGATWAVVAVVVPGAAPALANVDLVAIAPDNSNIVAVCDRTSLAGEGVVYVTTNGGATWGTLAVPTGYVIATSTVNDMDISAVGQGANHLFVAGSVAGAAQVWYYPLGIGGSWTATAALGGFPAAQTIALAVKCSPNFASDTTVMVVTTAAGAVNFSLFSRNASLWNANAAVYGAAYPVAITAAGAATAASIAPAPTYLGGDEVERVAFVGLTTGAAATRGVYRLKDTNCVSLSTAADMYSVAYDGATLVAGSTGTAVTGPATVWRCTDPLAANPVFYPTSAAKSPGGLQNACVIWAGSTVAAGTIGNESAFAISTDDGASFNDISLIDTAITNMEDVAVSPDGNNMYLLTDDAADLSVWRYDGSWQRVLTRIADIAYIVRVASDDIDSVYVCDTNSNALFYSATGGQTKWYSRTAPTAAVLDLGVESSSIAYVGSAAGIQKTENSGFTWGPPQNTKVNPAQTITILGEDQLIVGNNAGMVSYSTDGAMTWNSIPQAVAAGAGNTVVTADKLEEGGNIYAGDAATNAIYKWVIGQAASEPWVAIDAGVNPTTGIALQNGVLYAAQTNGAASTVRRNNAPFLPPTPPPFDNLAAGATGFTLAPSSLRVSVSSTYIKLWAVDTVPAADALMSYMDTQALQATTLSTPVDKFVASVNPISGAIANVTFTWMSVPGVNPPAGRYQLDVALDEGFGQLVFTNAALAAAGGPMQAQNSVALIIPLNPGFTYYWRVRVTAPLTGNWSEVRSLSVEATGAMTPEIGSPENGATLATGTPGFSWAPVAEATKYEFQLASDPAFGSIVYTAETVTTAAAVDSALADGIYYWRVRAIEPAESEWSPVATINVAVAAAQAEQAPVQVEIPDIVIPPIEVPQATVVVEDTGEAAPVISEGLLWAVIIIGAVLVIAVIVLIVRTRRNV